MRKTHSAGLATAPRSPSASLGYGLMHEARAARAIVTRELIRVVNHDLGRMFTMALTPLLYLLVIGNGIGILVEDTDGVGLKTFIFPGVVAMAVITAAVNSAVSLVWDQESGFVREMLVAPVSSTTIVVGKVLSGTILSAFQGAVVLAFAGAAGIPYEPGLLLSLLAVMVLTSATVSAFGVLLAIWAVRMESFQGVTHLAVMPLLFLSGALFPLADLPRWLSLLTHLNPLTYAVDPMRNAVFLHLEVSPAAHERYNPGVSWFGWTVPPELEVAVVAAAGVLFTVMAARRLSRTR